MITKTALVKKDVHPDPVEIPLLDLRRKFTAVEDKIKKQWDEIFSSMHFLNGPNLSAFEKEFARYCGVTHAIGVASGTDAIHLSLVALGVGAGDEVILPAHAPAPVIEPVIYRGAVPVLVDKAKGDYGPDLKGIRAAINRKTKAILAVHLLGLPCDMDAISAIARRYRVPVVEDASQAHGGLYRGKRAGSLGTIAPMGLGPVKNLACYGDGGIVLTNDAELAERLRLLRVHGQAEKYDHRIYGWNSRLDELQAAVLRVKLPTLDRDNSRRREIAKRYSEAFRRLPIRMPPTFSDRVSVYHQYVIETNERDSLRAFLREKRIGTGMYYPLPLHQHEAWLARGLPRYCLPESERYGRQNLALPVFAELTDEEVQYITASVRQYFCTKR